MPSLPLLSFHCFQTQRLQRTPIFGPLLIAVTHGEKTLRIGERLWRCPAGSWLALRGPQRVELINQPDTASGTYQAWALGEQDGWLQRLHELYGAQLAGLGSSEPAQLFAPNASALHAFEQLLGLLPKAQAGSLRGARAEHAWQGLMLALAEAGQAGVLFNRRPLHWHERALHLLRGDLSRHWQAEELATHLAMSPATLRRKLASEGISFRRLLQDARMEQALGLVSASSEPLGAIAASCGYQSPSRFAAAFQRHYGMSPSQLRQTRETG